MNAECFEFVSVYLEFVILCLGLYLQKDTFGCNNNRAVFN